MQRYPKTLSTGNNNTVIALSEKEVAKLFVGDTRTEIGAEAEKMKWANQTNGLVVKFIRLDFDEADQTEMLVMERLYPLDYRSFELEKRELCFEVFEEELAALHTAGFVHRDLKRSAARRPSGYSGLPYDNIFLTDAGLRLIDVGISALRSQVGEKIFAHYVAQEQQELREFKQYFLTR